MVVLHFTLVPVVLLVLLAMVGLGLHSPLSTLLGFHKHAMATHPAPCCSLLSSKDLSPVLSLGLVWFGVDLIEFGSCERKEAPPPVLKNEWPPCPSPKTRDITKFYYSIDYNCN